MNAFVLIVWLMTSSGPVEVRREYEGQGRVCEALARDVRLGTRPVPRGTVLISARCTTEYEA